MYIVTLAKRLLRNDICRACFYVFVALLAWAAAIFMTLNQ